MKEITFSKQGDIWVAEFVSSGPSVMQIERSGKGELAISQFMDGMEPCACKKYSAYNGRENLIVSLDIVEGMNVKIQSTTGVNKCYLMASNEEILTEVFSCEDEAVCYDVNGELLEVKL